MRTWNWMLMLCAVCVFWTSCAEKVTPPEPTMSPDTVKAEPAKAAPVTVSETKVEAPVLAEVKAVTEEVAKPPVEAPVVTAEAPEIVEVPVAVVPVVDPAVVTAEKPAVVPATATPTSVPVPIDIPVPAPVK